jgi:hypothetical protein
MTAAKALAALITTVLSPFLLARGISLDMSLEQVIMIIVTAAVSTLSVYIVPNKSQ